MLRPRNFFIAACFIFTANAHAACVINTKNQQPLDAQDAIAQLLRADSGCAQDVFALRALIQHAGLKLETTLVANRGFHNPNFGSFSLFEMVTGRMNNADYVLQPGEFFFGHFTKINREGYLTPDQTPAEDALMIEAFAWDPKKELFNYYELIGNGKTGQWFYRGDSSDILADNTFLHLQPDPNHWEFGNRLRCSACHSAGGPIMKELNTPHNDWWEPNRKLDFGGRKPDAELNKIFTTLVPAEYLAESVHLGIRKLQQSKKFLQIQHSLSLPEQLRPLFCPVELNLQSDLHPNEAQQKEIAIPSEFFVDARLLHPDTVKPIMIAREHYENTLKILGSRFPETNLKDADHAWLTPVKAESDKLAISSLIERGIIDNKFMADVLSVDMTNPVISQERCKLLRFVPQKLSAHWHQDFINNLSAAHDKNAQQLLKNLTNPAQTLAFYQQKASLFINHCRKKLTDNTKVRNMYQLLAQRRAEVFAAEISGNPLGQILEPGFRVIFPEIKDKPIPHRLKLNEVCDVV